METNPFRARRQVGEAPPEAEAPEQADEAPGGVHGWIEGRVAGKNWWIRAPLLLLLAWFCRGYLVEFDYTTIFSGVTLGFHEMGHAFFSWFGNRILTAAGGTIFQLAVPTAAAVYLALKQRDPFGATVCTFWLGTALVQAGTYAADARAQALPLVSPFGPVDVDSHDWTVMLMKFGKLSRDEAIADFLHDAGMVVMAASLLAGAWVLWIMARSATD